MDILKRIEELKTEISRLEGALPKHSVSATMIIRLEELEEELTQIEKVQPRSAIGLVPGIVKLLPYNDKWSDLFKDEKNRLEAAVGQFILDIQHVGSTSIPDMIAKPIIDIAIAVKDFEEARSLIPSIEELGYEFRGELGVPGRHYFRKGNPRSHHLHMYQIDNPHWLKTLAFRDHMTANPDTAQDYASLKTNLAQQYPEDRVAYTDSKSKFILSILHKEGFKEA